MSTVELAGRAGRSFLALMRLLVLFALPAVTMTGGCMYCGQQLTRLDRQAAGELAAARNVADGGTPALSVRYSAER